MFFMSIHLRNNLSCLKVFYNHCVLNITWRLLLLANRWATVLFLNTDVFKTSRNHKNMLGSVMTNNNSKIFLRPLWFLLLKDSTITVPYIQLTQQQSRNQVLENHCVFSLTYYMWKIKLISINSDLLNQSARQLNQELRHGH